MPHSETHSTHLNVTDTVPSEGLLLVPLWNTDFSVLSGDHNGSIESLNVKEWQDGLRALLPNININFGGLPSSTSSSSSSSSSSSVNHIGGPGGPSSGVSHSLSWDATASWMDPAIITGQSGRGLPKTSSGCRSGQSLLRTIPTLGYYLLYNTWFCLTVC